MNAKELLDIYLNKDAKKRNCPKEHAFLDFTLIICKYEKDDHSPFCHEVYETTPIYHYSRTQVPVWLDEYVCMSHDQMPIDFACGSSWRNPYEDGRLVCFTVSTMEELEKQYCHKQAQSMVDYCDKKIREIMKDYID